MIGEATPEDEFSDCKYCNKKVKHVEYDNYWVHENDELFCSYDDRTDE